MKNKILKHIGLTAGIIAMGWMTASCNFQTEKLKSTGITATRALGLPAFDKLHAAYNYQVELIPSQKDSLYVETDSALMPYLRIQCENGTLVLDLDIRIRMDDAEIKAKLFCQKLERIRCSGASAVTSQDTLQAENLEIKLSGASYARLPLKAGQLQVECSGASQFGGYCEADHAGFQLSGASLANPEGHIRQGAVVLSGSSNFKNQDMVFDRLAITASGASNAHVTVLADLEAKASGASSVHYYGDPETDIATSGGSSVKAEDEGIQ